MHRLWWDQTAEPERVAGVAGIASAGRQVVDHLADGVLAARSGTRVLALVPDAGSVGRTVTVENAFRSTAFVGVPDVFR